MNLNYPLPDPLTEMLSLAQGEDLWYCVPLDLIFDNGTKLTEESYTHNTWLAVTPLRLFLLHNGVISVELALKDCEKIKCEHQVNSGILTVTDLNGSPSCIARFSMRHIIRVSYVARGAQSIIDAQRKSSNATRISRKSGESAQASHTNDVTLQEVDVSPQSGTVSPERVISHEPEKYCMKCGRALPGTNHCPYCDGKGVVFKKFMNLCGDYVHKLVLISLLMIITAAINLISPMIQQHFIDNALSTGAGTWRDLWFFIGTTFALLVGRILVSVYRYWCCVKLGAELSMTMRRKLYYKIQTLSLSFLNKRKPGELMNRVAQDTQRIRMFMEEVFSEMFSVLLTMIVSLIMMLFISWKMTLLSMTFIIIVFLIAKAYWHYIRTIFHKQWLKADDLSSNLQDIISGMRVVKSFGKEERETERFTAKANAFAAISKRNETFWATFYPLLTFLMGAGTYIAVFFGGRNVLIGQMSLGQLVQFMTYTGYLFGPLSWMTYLPRAIMQMITSLNRIYDVLDENPQVDDKPESKKHLIQGAFSFKDVSFGYETYEPVLENINFDVKPGEMIGLVGASGTGKSTLINLIMRLYDVDQGQITIDGVDIRDIKTECLHSQIGVVLQETFLFSGSILANIRFAKQDATLAEVIQAAKAANAHDFICKTPDGYNTYVGEHGYNLSGGERQRIAIARAILNNPRLLILDEATSALDTESEFLIQLALDRLVKGRTTFAIAHRLSTLRNADRLVVIDKHGVAEIGTHNELLEKKGIYYGLVTAQLAMAEGK